VRPRGSPLDRAAGLVRLTHPFPSVLDGIATAALATLAGAVPSDAARLGIAMTLLQFAIGSTNDALDAERDAGREDKPIPSGLVGRRPAAVASIVFAAGGLVLSAVSGAATLGVALLGLATGLAYDLRFRGTSASWLPFAVGVPLLPVYAWVGATGGLTIEFAVLVPCAMLAGMGIAVANALADVERDRRVGVDSIARRLGPQRAWRIHAALLGAASAGALASVLALRGAGERGEDVGVLVALAGVAIVAFGSRLAARSASVDRGWEVEAVGLAVLAVGWAVAIDLGT
jgi:4-hydroxybenzoate polyprenyltransferase